VFLSYWQKALLKAGYLLPKYGADSDFGSETEAATKAFQAKQLIPVTGIVNTLTFAYMLNVLQGITSVDPALTDKLAAAELVIAGLRVDLNNEKTLFSITNDTLKAEQDRAQRLRDALTIIKSY
jgi:peptidoglycan hydrolase-like protein with peptidoglycan-binding domain